MRSTVKTVPQLIEHYQKLLADGLVDTNRPVFWQYFPYEHYEGVAEGDGLPEDITPEQWAKFVDEHDHILGEIYEDMVRECMKEYLPSLVREWNEDDQEEYGAPEPQ